MKAATSDAAFFMALERQGLIESTPGIGRATIRGFGSFSRLKTNE
jgi:hypothetical protein